MVARKKMLSTLILCAFFSHIYRTCVCALKVPLHHSVWELLEVVLAIALEVAHWPWQSLDTNLVEYFSSVHISYNQHLEVVPVPSLLYLLPIQSSCVRHICDMVLPCRISLPVVLNTLEDHSLEAYHQRTCPELPLSFEALCRPRHQRRDMVYHPTCASLLTCEVLMTF